VLLGGLANFGTLIGTRTRLQFNNTYNRTADNDARIERGVFEDLAIPLEVQRMDYVQRSLYSSQLAGEHDLGRQGLDWSVNVAGVSRDQPDRSEFVTEQRGAQNLWLSSLPEGAVRTFAALDERSTEGKLNYKLLVGPAATQTTIRVGGLYRDTRRDSDVRAFGVFANTLDDATRLLPPEQLFGGRFTGESDAVLSVRSLAQGGSYRAADDLTAGFVMGDVPLGRRFGGDLRFIGGARLERSNVTVDAVSTLAEATQAVRRFTDVLPSLALNWKPSEMVNVRTSVTRTLARPEYRELAGIRTREVLGGIDTRGNPNLIRTLIDNYDLRWEWYPSAGEILSVGVFGKRFQDPIERVFRPSNTNSLVEFQNAQSATNYGVEFEARKGLAFVAQSLAPVSAFANVTLMRQTN
jgi:outer membrane receptor protein involved in Fe transport